MRFGIRFPVGLLDNVFRKNFPVIISLNYQPFIRIMYIFLILLINNLKGMKNILNLILFVILFVAFGCSDDNNNNPPAGNPVFSVKLVDAPSAYDAVNVEIVGMEANTGTGWITLPLDTTGVYNLLSFTNGNSLPLLNDTVVDPCTITELRLILGTNNTVVVNGETYDLKTPSGQTSGYKIKMEPQTLEPGGIYHLVIDFNTEKSVHQTGNGKYMLKPVVTGYLENSVGGIAGTISPGAGAYYVEATNATDTWEHI